MLIKLLKCMNQGTEQNTLCYDEFAKSGEFTRRLVVLMKYISIENGNTSPLSEIYVSRMAFRQIFCWSSNPALDHITLDAYDHTINNDTIHDESQYTIYTMGIHVIISDDLGLVWEMNKSGHGGGDTYGNLMHVFTENNSYIEYCDKELVIGMSEDRSNVMLGSF